MLYYRFKNEATIFLPQQFVVIIRINVVHIYVVISTDCATFVVLRTNPDYWVDQMIEFLQQIWMACVSNTEVVIVTIRDS